MAKVRPIFSYGGWAERSGKTIIANKPHFRDDRVYSAAQITHQDSFQEASSYAKQAQVTMAPALGVEATAQNLPGNTDTLMVG